MTDKKVSSKYLKTIIERELTNGVFCLPKPTETKADKRSKIIEVPKKPVLVNPMCETNITTDDQRKVKKRASKRSSSINKKQRTSAGASFSVPNPMNLFKGSASGEMSSEEKTSGKQGSSTADGKEETVQEALVPLASYYLTLKDIKFTPIALNHLKSISQMIEECKEEKEIQSQSKEFIKNYGTHILQGPIHFGGKFTRKEHKLKQDRMTARELGSSMNSSLGGSLSGQSPSLPLSGSVGGQHATGSSESKPTENALKSEEQTNAIQLCGGPVASDFMVWKETLLKTPSQWSMIGIDNDMIPIPEVIENNYLTKIKHAPEIAKHLKNAASRKRKPGLPT